MIKNNLNSVRDNINSACERSGRKLSEVTLVAVSKTKPLALIEEAFMAGQIDFGENKAVELRDKAEQINLNLRWHFIGHLQTNKVKYVIEPTKLIHSVENESLADEIQKRAEKIGKVQDILIEMNTSGEESKYGISNFSDLMKLIDYCKKLNRINVIGLMTMAPFVDDEKILRNTFRNLFEFREKANMEGAGLTELSMGMTNDYEYAILEGSTMLRIGTAIFGSRS